LIELDGTSRDTNDSP